MTEPLVRVRFEERERCARICETLAAMVDDGAGAVGRLWQAARMIRDGKPVPSFHDPSRKEPAAPRDPDGEVRRLRDLLDGVGVGSCGGVGHG